MQLLGHAGLALAGFAPVVALALARGRPRPARVGVAGVLALSMVPDVDLYLAGVPHRGITHTAAAVVVVAATVALAAGVLGSPVRGFDRGWARFGALVGAVAVGSHLLGDVLTPMGIRPFLPLSGETYTLSLVHAADPAANVALFGVGVTAVSLAIARGGRGERVSESRKALDVDETSGA